MQIIDDEDYEQTEYLKVVLMYQGKLLNEIAYIKIKKNDIPINAFTIISDEYACKFF